ncbi:hypothetical protein TEA_004010 [Camellia sinensis var. sinensis]|uniref:SPX domain-containing protein n=1 Tax=Camellia sinensis var. sinensis TaxID=542762 RepID=A0A4S4DD62_CAMSN|nr:hypothetical protein TEA_004010 [Camellia sinensis var. sinensis]
MKFGKEFASQMVQEWQEAYMAYNYLKTLLKDISHFRQRNASSPNIARTPKGSLKRRLSLYRAFSGLTSRCNNLRLSPKKNNEGEVILVSAVQEEGSPEGNYYETMFLMSSDEGGEYELVFFRRLDDEFNKVIKFYREKVKELIKEAEELNKKMNALIALRIKVDKPVIVSTTSQEINEIRSHMDAIQEVEMSTEGTMEDEPETSISTLKNIIMSSKSDLSFSKQELRKVEEKMRQAFIEFYQKLRLLKSYCFLNQLAFSKIMKKYDKQDRVLDTSLPVNLVLPQVTRLMERVESTFIMHFSNGNRKKGINTLRPQARRERHRVTYFLGKNMTYITETWLLLSSYKQDLLKSEARGQYMENIFPLCSLFGYIVLHMIMYAGNTYFWKRFRINYPFLFGFKLGTELGYGEVLLLGSGLAILTLAGVISNLDMDMDPRIRSFRTITELVPLGLVTLVFLKTFCPFNIVYRSNRFFLIKCAFHCLCAPLYKVTLPDFFLADQFTSQCLRRLFEEGNYMHALNTLKYCSTTVAIVMRTGNDQKWGKIWKIMAGSSSAVATLASTYWDIVIDWGLMRRNSRNPWLRDKLLISNKSVYFVAIVLDVMLRLAWMQSVLGFYEAPFLHRTAVIAIVACLEIIHRGI